MTSSVIARRKTKFIHEKFDFVKVLTLLYFQDCNFFQKLFTCFLCIKCNLLSVFLVFVFACGENLPSKTQRGPDKKPRKRGSNHKNYKHGLGKSRDYDPLRYSAWKQGVLQKDNFCCFITGERNTNLLSVIT